MKPHVQPPAARLLRRPTPNARTNHHTLASPSGPTTSSRRGSYSPQHGRQHRTRACARAILAYTDPATSSSTRTAASAPSRRSNPPRPPRDRHRTRRQRAALAAATSSTPANRARRSRRRPRSDPDSFPAAREGRRDPQPARVVVKTCAAASRRQRSPDPHRPGASANRRVAGDLGRRARTGRILLLVHTQAPARRGTRSLDSDGRRASRLTYWQHVIALCTTRTNRTHCCTPTFSLPQTTPGQRARGSRGHRAGRTVAA